MKKIAIILSLLTTIMAQSLTFAQSDVSAAVNTNGTSTASSTAKPYNTSYDFDSYQISGTNSFSTDIDLSSNQPYGKAYYSNNSSEDVTLSVDDHGSITIKPYKSGGITWKKSAFKSTYNVDLHCSTKDLNGLFSLAKSDKAFS